MSLLAAVRGIIQARGSVVDLAGEVVRELEENVFGRACEIVGEWGGEGGEDPSPGLVSEIASWAQGKYPDDALAVWLWDAFIKHQCAGIVCLYPKQSSRPRTWATAIAHQTRLVMSEFDTPIDFNFRQTTELVARENKAIVAHALLNEEWVKPALGLVDGSWVGVAKMCQDAYTILDDPTTIEAGRAGDRLWALGVSHCTDFTKPVQDEVVKVMDRLVDLQDQPNFGDLYVGRVWWALADCVSPGQVWAKMMLRADARQANLVTDHFELGPDTPRIPQSKLINEALRMCSKEVHGRKRVREEDGEGDPGRKYKRARELTVPERLCRPHEGGKDLDSDLFHLRPGAAPSAIDVHDLEAFRRARMRQFGATDIVKLCGGKFNDVNRWLRVFRGEEMKDPVGQDGWNNMRMGHNNEPKAIDAFIRAFPGTTLSGSRFYHIPGTPMVITPDEVLDGNNAGFGLEEFFDEPHPPIQSVEVKCHIAGIKTPDPKKTRGGVTYYPHSATYIQGLLQCIAVNGWTEVPEGIVPAFFLVDHHPATGVTQVYHIRFPDPSFATTLLEHAETCRKALLADEPPNVPEPDLPFHTVTFTRIS